MAHFEKRVDRELLYDGKVFDVYRDSVELEDGSTTIRELVEHNGGVAVLALDAENKVFMVRQFRYGAGETLLELPAGKLEKGENPRACGIRELEEETGYVAAQFDFLAQIIPTPAYDSERIDIFLARGLTPTGKGQHLDEGEFLTVERIPFKEVLEMCMDGRIIDAKTVAGVLKYHMLHEYVQRSQD